MSSVEEATEVIDDIMDLIEELPERAEEFGDSIRDKTVDISSYIEEKNHVTPAQLLALQNMRAGIMKWLDR